LTDNESKGLLEVILGALHQTFDKKELYTSIEEKAAHLLYGGVPFAKAAFPVIVITVLLSELFEYCICNRFI